MHLSRRIIIIHKPPLPFQLLETFQAIFVLANSDPISPPTIYLMAFASHLCASSPFFISSRQDKGQRPKVDEELRMQPSSMMNCHLGRWI
ncbi:hypothetical protein HID58_078261 [Brassica napus]|uniref:Uncharacterized protein n=1 Tax=Brassica napus TaxID=3708 RepID=A0ABQ7YSN6_BRANA|nr:hypothetical protein HID58_078261 [Brassica napus]